MSQVHISAGALDNLGTLARDAGVTGRAFVLSDDNVRSLYGRRAEEGLRRAGFEVVTHSVPAGESSKSLETAFAVYDWLVEERAERSDFVVALGGGVVGDLGGFVASTYLRGMPLVQVPTTLIAQIDSAIGGKVAVNHPRGKNLIGAFKDASLVVVDTSTLGTLPRRELASGWAEVVKTGFILDEEMLRSLESSSEALMEPDLDVATPIVRRSVDHKLAIVAEDPTERGVRVILNYGHTIAHALETVTRYAVFAHGEAVAIGMMGAAMIAQRLGLIDESLVRRHESALRAFGLPVRGSERPGLPIRPELVLDALLLDKKVRGGQVRWVLLEGVGRTIVRQDVPRELVAEVVRSLL